MAGLLTNDDLSSSGPVSTGSEVMGRALDEASRAGPTVTVERFGSPAACSYPVA